MMKKVIECKNCRTVLDSDECGAWKQLTCRCGASHIRKMYDMGDIFIDTLGDYEVVME